MRFWSLTLYCFVFCFSLEVTGLSMRNEYVGKCVQVHESQAHSGLTLEECETGSGLQEWHWNSETRSLRNPQTGKCLTAVNVQQPESVELQVCRPEEEGQAWVCSKKGHLILDSKDLHLSARQDSSKIFLSMERVKSSKWKTLNKKTVCEEKTDSVPPKTQSEPENTGPRIITNIRLWHCKICLGTTDLLFTRKTVVVLKSSSEQTSQPGSPERAPLTKHALRPPVSPSIQRGEILVEWKDGTVTPLFDTYFTS
uniref:Ricin B lectin domain-containing protein n=1 Tax=Electrophorus electricus TaxID=8005 RepID=A0A4W4EAN4_ELEEL